jgi:hypothetical protein
MAEPMRQQMLLWSALLLILCPGILNCQSNSEFDFKAVAKDMEERFKACPRREVVAQFDRKHPKQAWQKQAMGPPSDVFIDIKPNDSLLWPYILTVEFTLRYTFGPERRSKQEAQEDSQLEVELAVGKLLTTRYRNTYLVSRDGIRVKAREFLPRTLDGTPSRWKERSIWPDACWDQFGAK